MSSAVRIASCGALIALGAMLLPAAQLAAAPADSQEPQPFTFVRGAVHGKLYLVAGPDPPERGDFIRPDLYEMARSYRRPKQLTEGGRTFGVAARGNVLVAYLFAELEGTSISRLRPGRLNGPPFRAVTVGTGPAIGPGGKLAVYDD